MAKYQTVAELFEDPNRWCKKSVAKDKDGNPCSVMADHAVSWCLVGGVEYVYSGDIKKCSEVFLKLTNALITKGFNELGLPTVWNDASEHGDILSLVKELDI